MEKITQKELNYLKVFKAYEALYQRKKHWEENQEVKERRKTTKTSDRHRSLNGRKK